MLAADNSAVAFKLVTVTVTTQLYHNVFHFRHSSLIVTLYCTYQVDSRFFTLYYTKTTLDIARHSISIGSGFLCSRSQEISSSSKMYSHAGNLETKTTSSVNSLTIYDHFPTVGLSFCLGLFNMFVVFLLLVIVN